jgi:hypothetical protein
MQDQTKPAKKSPVPGIRGASMTFPSFEAGLLPVFPGRIDAALHEV